MLAALAVLGWFTGIVPPGRARVLHTVLQDDTLALYRPHALQRFAAALRWLGVDELRVSAEWKLEAPDPDSRRPPSGFDPARPASYTGAGMRLLDTAVRAATAAGLHVIVDPAFSAPLWATSEAASGPAPRGTSRDRWFNTNIDVHAAAAWEQMLARRYNGIYVPPGQVRPLPRVDTFTLWNEPNLYSEIKPQWRGGVPVSADWYRSLVALAYPAIKRVSPASTVLIGNTSDAGADAEAHGAGVAPLAFIRRLACVDTRLEPVTDGACAHFSTVPADGYAHHPYEREAPPWVPSTGSGQADWAQMGDLPRLQSLLGRLVAMHRLAPGAENVWLTEQGYESNAQLPDRPWTEAEQASLNAASEYLAWRDPHAASFSQFLLRDTLTRETLALRARTGHPHALVVGTWTTGLVRENYTAKPALSMFRSPVLARTVGPVWPAPPFSAADLAPPMPGPTQYVEIWGRARPAAGGTVAQIQIASRPGVFETVATVVTDRNGIFDLTLPAAGDTQPEVRFRWIDVSGAWQTSPAAAPLTFPLPGQPEASAGMSLRLLG